MELGCVKGLGFVAVELQAFIAQQCPPHQLSLVVVLFLGVPLGSIGASKVSGIFGTPVWSSSVSLSESSIFWKRLKPPFVKCCRRRELEPCTLFTRDARDRIAAYPLRIASAARPFCQIHVASTTDIPLQHSVLRVSAALDVVLS